MGQQLPRQNGTSLAALLGLMMMTASAGAWAASAPSMPIEKAISLGAGDYPFTTAAASYSCTLSGNSPDVTITFYGTYVNSSSCTSGILTFNLFNLTPAPVLSPSSSYQVGSGFVNAAVNRIVNISHLATPTCMAITNLFCSGHGQATYTNKFWNISCSCDGSSCSCSPVAGAPQITFPPLA